MSFNKKKLSIREQASLDKKKNERKHQRRFDSFLKNYKQSTISSAIDDMRLDGKVPIVIDHKTTIWVNVEKCYKNNQGLWIKK